MKIIQLNAWCFNCGEDLLDFIADEKPDILNLQEVETPGFLSFGRSYSKIDGKDYFQTLKDQFGYQGEFFPNYISRDKQGRVGQFGNGFLTTLPIVDFVCDYDQPIEEGKIDWRHQIYSPNPHDRVVAAWDFPANILTSVLEYQGQLIRNITTHFRVTQRCSETKQTVDHARRVIKILDSSKQIPTLLSGDFNIFPESFSVRLLSERLEKVNVDSKTTLNLAVHPAVKFGDLKDGITVDYIFQKGFNVQNWRVPEVNVSDHLPIVAEVEM